MLVQGKLPGSGPHLMYGIQDVLLGYAKAYARELLLRPLKNFYSYKIRYQPEPANQRFEDWADPWTVIERGWGDCDDMVLWRLAEILVASKWQEGDPLPAWPLVAQKIGTENYHVLLRHRSGKTEDPAAIMEDFYKDQKNGNAR